MSLSSCLGSSHLPFLEINEFGPRRTSRWTREGTDEVGTMLRERRTRLWITFFGALTGVACFAKASEGGPRICPHNPSPEIPHLHRKHQKWIRDISTADDEEGFAILAHKVKIFSNNERSVDGNSCVGLFLLLGKFPLRSQRRGAIVLKHLTIRPDEFQVFEAPWMDAGL